MTLADTLAINLALAESIKFTIYFLEYVTPDDSTGSAGGTAD
jgi:hypothetical protein